MKLLITERCGGKTTECIRLMRENPDTIMFVLNTDMIKNLPKDIQDRTFSIKSCQWMGRDFKKVIIDNLEFMNDRELRKIEGIFDVVFATMSSSCSFLKGTWKKEI